MENWQGYLQRAFELTRQFKYIWTVNWKMLPEETFLDRKFHAVLLVSVACFVGVLWGLALRLARQLVCVAVYSVLARGDILMS